MKLESQSMRSVEHQFYPSAWVDQSMWVDQSYIVYQARSQGVQ